MALIKSKQSVTRAVCNRFEAGTVTTGVASISLNPTNYSTRAAAIADSFQLFRIVGCRFRMHPLGFPASLAQASLMAGYVPDFVDTQPAGFSSLGEYGQVAYMAGISTGAGSNNVPCQTVASNWVSVPRTILAGSLPWYKAVPGAPDSWDEVAGTIYITEDGTTGSVSRFLLEIQTTYEFKGATDPVTTPAMRAQAAERREREKIMRLIASTPSGGVKGLPQKNLP